MAQVLDMVSRDGRTYARGKKNAYAVGRGMVGADNSDDVKAIVNFGYDKDTDTLIGFVQSTILSTGKLVKFRIQVPLGPIRREVVLAMHRSILGLHNAVAGPYQEMSRYIKKRSAGIVSKVGGAQIMGSVKKVLSNPKFQRDFGARPGFKPSISGIGENVATLRNSARKIAIGLLNRDPYAMAVAGRIRGAALHGIPAARIAMVRIAGEYDAVIGAAQTADELWTLSGF